MTHSCDHCGSPVSDRYYRVMSVDGTLPACPSCPDRKVSSSHAAGWREARGPSGRDSGGPAPTTYEEDYGE